jgi:hypothetical protein
MRPKDERIQRILLGALVSADLSPRDLFEIAGRLEGDRRFTEHLSYLIRNAAEMLNALQTRRQRSLLSEPDPLEETIADVLRLFERRRMPKQQALRIVRSVARSKPWRPKPSATLRNNVADLLNSCSEDERRRFVADVAKALGLSEDPYLRELAQ